VPQLRAQFPGAVFGLSNWGPDFDDILTNPGKYGINNTTDPCFNFATGATCSDPDKHFYYFVVHPSDVSHHIVGNELFTEVLALPSVPSPVPGPIAGGSLRAVAFSAGGDGESGLGEQTPLGVRLVGNLLSRCRCSPSLRPEG